MGGVERFGRFTPLCLLAGFVVAISAEMKVVVISEPLSFLCLCALVPWGLCAVAEPLDKEPNCFYFQLVQDADSEVIRSTVEAREGSAGSEAKSRSDIAKPSHYQSGLSAQSLAHLTNLIHGVLVGP